MMQATAPRVLIGGLLALGLTVGGGGAAIAQPPRGPQNFALASDIVAREIAFARTVREKGQWKAFRAFAADDAQMFDGATPVRVQAFAKSRPDPANLLQWTTHAVWMSCDGSVGVSYGAWRAGGATGWFSTVWQRQKKGDYRFVLDQGGDRAARAQVDDDLPIIDAKVADCPARAPRQPVEVPPMATAPDAPQDHLSGASRDQTLTWTTTLRPDGTRDYHVAVRQGDAMREVLPR